MKRLTLTILAALIAVQISHAGWWRTYGGEGYDVGNCVQITSDGNYIIAGNKADSMWLLKVDTLGYEIWSKTYKSNEYESYANWLEETSDGGFIVCGSPDLMKVTSEGDSVWAQDYGIQAQCVQETDGGYAVTGYTGFYGDTSWLIKTDAVGDSLWTQFYANPEHNRNKTYFLQTTSDGGYIMIGTTEIMTEDFITGYLWLIKTDLEGNVEWTKEYGTGQDGRFNAGYCVRETYDSCLIITGHSSETGGLWFLKTDSLGDTIWTQNYGSGIGFSIQETTDSGYIIAGTNINVLLCQTSPDDDDLYLIKTDSNGDTLWTRLYGGHSNDVGKCIQQTGDEGYIISGYTRSYGAGLRDIYLLKTDSLGFLAIDEKLNPESIKDWQLLTAVGSKIILSYANHSQGFKAFVFDASGRKVVEIHSPDACGVIAWGEGRTPGVYFIQVVDNSNKTSTAKFVLVR